MFEKIMLAFLPRIYILMAGGVRDKERVVDCYSRGKMVGSMPVAQYAKLMRHVMFRWQNYAWQLWLTLSFTFCMAVFYLVIVPSAAFVGCIILMGNKRTMADVTTEILFYVDNYQATGINDLLPYLPHFLIGGIAVSTLLFLMSFSKRLGVYGCKNAFMRDGSHLLARELCENSKGVIRVELAASKSVKKSAMKQEKEVPRYDPELDAVPRFSALSEPMGADAVGQGI